MESIVLTTYLMGGLGNQMFQYAIGRAQAKRLGVGLQLDTSFFGSWYHHEYMLDQWQGVTEPTVLSSERRIEEQGLPYQNIVPVDGQTLYGYWQCERYFAD